MSLAMNTLTSYSVPHTPRPAGTRLHAAFAFACLLALNVCAMATAATPAPQPTSYGELFAYDAAASLEVKDAAPPRKNGDVTVRDITFKPLKDAPPVHAYIVSPPCKPDCAGVLWVHWLGEPATTNRTEFLAEAEGLARKGVVSVLVDAMWSAPEWYAKRDPEQDFAHSVQQVVALRRALDLLVSQPHVDKSRIALVGHDYGGMYGMLAAGADRRPKTCIFMATASSLNDWAFFARQPASKVDYLRKNAVLELTDALHALGDTSVLYQFAKNDEYVSHADSSVLLAAVPGRKERKFYDAGHSLEIAQAGVDRDAWLVKELGLEEKKAE
jgi:dienelactone hydrolase